MELCSSKLTNLYKGTNIEELKIINEKLILEIGEVKPNDHISEKRVTQFDK